MNNEEGFLDEVKLIKQLGFDGKSVISPRQVHPVHEVFCPNDKEIDHAICVIQAIKEAEKKNSGVISLNGKMVDKPIVDRARRVLEMAKATGIRINELEEYCDE